MIRAEAKIVQPNEIPRRYYNGKPAGPLVIPPDKKLVPGDFTCEMCGRKTTPNKRRPRKGNCYCTYYKRCTTWIDVLQDEFALKKWDRRMVAYGMSQRPDLVLAAAAMGHPDSSLESKTGMQSTADAAVEHARGSAAANVGTALHKLTERMDNGETLGFVPDPFPADLKAYDQCIEAAGIEWVAVESFRVHDEYKVGGTTDRIGWYKNRLRIFDLKGLALNTPLPTPTGWTTMGAVQVGDKLFDENGNSCDVIAKSQTKRIGTYVVSFDDGTNVVCDSEHIWWTQTHYDRARGTGPWPRTVANVRNTLKYGRQDQHTVPVVKSLDLPEVELPIAPYVLGAWLGDGTYSNGYITKQDDLFDIIESDGHRLGKRQVDKRNGVITRTVLGLRVQLRQANLLGHKAIPQNYLRASHCQRLQLLQGLMDTDGTWNTARRRAVFNSTDKALAHQVQDLLLTLGQRPTLSEYSTTGFGKRVTAYAVEFLPVDIKPFRLPRKAAKAVAQKPVNPTSAKRRVIVSVEPGPDVETACIAVDSPNRVYLCGESMIPTHNTSPNENPIMYPHGPAMQLAMYAHSVPYIYPGDYRTKDAADVDLNVAYIINMPAGTGRCELRPINIAKGWGACLLAVQVWRWRDTKDLILDPDLVRDNSTFKDMAGRAGTVAELKMLWRNAKESGALTDDLKDALTQRANELKDGAA